MDSMIQLHLQVDYVYLPGLSMGQLVIIYDDREHHPDLRWFLSEFGTIPQSQPRDVPYGLHRALNPKSSFIKPKCEPESQLQSCSTLRSIQRFWGLGHAVQN